MYFRLRVFGIEVVEILTRSPEDVVREFIESLEDESGDDEDDEGVVHNDSLRSAIDDEDEPLELYDSGVDVFDERPPHFGF